MLVTANGNNNGTKPVELNILIIGAGIAGLTAAACCLEHGFKVTLLESSRQFAHVRETEPSHTSPSEHI